MARFNILDLMNASSVEDAAAAGTEYQETTLDLSQIVVTKHNKYSMDDLQELATGIEMDGLQQPLVLGRVNGEWWLVSGHRRHAALSILVNEGKEEFAKVPCRFKDMAELEFRIALLVGNTFNRKMTDFDLMHQAREWKEVLRQAKKEGLLTLGKNERIRDYVAQILKEPTGKIGQLEAINNNATDEVKQEFEKGTMGISAAYNASRLDPEEQKEIAEKAATGADVKCEEIRQQAEEKKKAKEEKLKEAAASDTDTTDEEKENAKKLHVLKMLEKYYIYLNADDLRVLDAMLEDAKRRKREYAIEDVGETGDGA